jgi:hypothetical protein
MSSTGEPRWPLSERHWGRARAFARRWAGIPGRDWRDADRDELESVAIAALLEAERTYRPSPAVPFLMHFHTVAKRRFIDLRRRGVPMARRKDQGPRPARASQLNEVAELLPARPEPHDALEYRDLAEALASYLSARDAARFLEAAEAGEFGGGTAAARSRLYRIRAALAARAAADLPRLLGEAS